MGARGEEWDRLLDELDALNERLYRLGALIVIPTEIARTWTLADLSAAVAGARHYLARLARVQGEL